MGVFKLRNRISQFLRAKSGSIAPTFAIILTFALAPTAAVTIDVARGMSGRNNLQDALDAAALAVAHLPSGFSQATITSTAQSWLNANLHDGSLGAVTLTVTSGTQEIDLTATSTIQTSIGAIGSFAGLSHLPVTAHSTVKWGLNHIELALVLDNTGSMSQNNKLSSLQTAATSLVDTLSASATQSGDPNALKIGVGPFSMTVNVGSTYKLSTWMSGAMPTAYGSDIFSTTGINRFTILTAMGQSWGGCVESRPMPYDIQDTAPTLTNGATLFVPFFAPDEPDDNKIQYSSSYSGNTTTSGNKTYFQFYNNYLADGTNSTNFNTRQGRSAKYVGSPASGTHGYWGTAIGPNAGCQTAALLRLSTNMTTVKSKLNAMIAAGDTEIPLGLMWGWHLLSPNTPFADGAAYGTANTVKIAVLVTDGQNTYSTGVNGNNNSVYTALGYVWQNRISTDSGDFSDPASALNDRLAKLCTNMKNAGVIVYTVPVEVTDTNVKSLLQSCASSADKYVDVSSSSQLQAAFNNIAGSISSLRIAS